MRPRGRFARCMADIVHRQVIRGRTSIQSRRIFLLAQPTPKDRTVHRLCGVAPCAGCLSEIFPLLLLAEIPFCFLADPGQGPQNTPLARVFPRAARLCSVFAGIVVQADMGIDLPNTSKFASYSRSYPVLRFLPARASSSLQNAASSTLSNPV
jgi:hypothetical protein